ncbi:hypothetical protein QIS74_06997 [Colletotrichum tabaci]|uniref:O-methyltransferase C-terminal domain-containing protein n=1 Tax=Colletotrichum tabaci TaxID=1209068 RepID=A0AAV9TA51_9PEZI
MTSTAKPSNANITFATKPSIAENGINGVAALSVKQIVSALDGVTLDTCDGSEEARYQLLEASRRLIARLETPFERMWYHTWVAFNNLAIFRIMMDLGLWEGWRAAGSEEASLDELLGYCKRDCDKSLFRRLLRHLTADHMLQETGVDRYKPTRLTIELGDSSTPTAAAIRGAIDHQIPSTTHFPSFLASTDYAEPRDHDATNYVSLDPDNLGLFARCQATPSKQESFITCMQGVAAMKTPWTRIYDTRELLTGRKQGAPLVVDVGGGHGRDLARVLEAYPDPEEGDLVLQDLPEVIRIAKPDEKGRIKCMEHDFFEKQPVTGARAYYMHTVLHDWDDERCRQILRSTAGAMTPGYSKLLLHETMMPARGANWYHAMVDVCIMHLVSAAERTEEQWRTLLASEGFRIVKIWHSNPSVECVIEAELAE